MKSVIILAIYLILSTCQMFAQVDFFQQCNGPYGGSIYDIEINMVDKIYAATLDKIYSSSDNGNTWEISMPSYSGGIKFIVTESNHLYTVNSQSIYKLIDNTNNWALLDTLPTKGLGISALASTSNEDLYIALTSRGILKYRQSGYTWINGKNGLTDTNITAIKIYNDTIFIGSEAAGVMMSTDAGDSWSQKNYGLPFGAIHNLNIDSKGYLFAVTDSGLYGSSDRGNMWGRINSIMNGWYRSFKTDVHDNLYILDQNSLNISTNGGLIFQQIFSNETFYPHWLNDVAVNSYGNIFVATSRGIYHASGAGTYSFNRLNDNWYINNSIYSLLRLPNQKFLAGAGGYVSYSTGSNGENVDYRFWGNGDGVFISNDGGVSWLLTNNDLTGKGIYSLAMKSSGEIFAGTYKDGIYKSTDLGINWTKVFNTQGPITCFTIAPNGNVLAGSWRLFSSTDNGLNWDSLSSQPNDITAMTLGQNGNVLVGSRYGFYKSTNSGKSFVQTGLRNEIHSLLAYPFGIIFAGTIEGLYRSTNNGTSWGRIDSNLINSTIFSLAMNSKGVVFAGGMQGLFRSTDYGNEWNQVYTSKGWDGMILTLNVDVNDFLFAGTLWRSIFRSVVSTPVIEEEIPSENSLSQNFPNPFNPTTSIRYELSFESHVVLKIYNVLGQLVETLIDGIQSEGHKSIDWNAGNNASGIYFYRLEVISKSDPSNSVTQVKKMLLVK